MHMPYPSNIAALPYTFNDQRSIIDKNYKTEKIISFKKRKKNEPKTTSNIILF